MTALTAEDEAILARVPASLRARNGVPDETDGAARERAAEIVRAALSDLLQPDGLRTSVLGPAWSRDLDLHLTRLPEPERLRGLGWIGLDGLFGRLGIGGRGQWAVVDDGNVLAVADLTLDPVPDPITSMMARCRRRGEVRAREVLELRALVREGNTLPPDDPVLTVAAGIERELHGDLLRRWGDGRSLDAPAPLPLGRASRFWKGVRRRASALRPKRRVVVAISGLDGAGKTTLAGRIEQDLRRVRVPVTTIWLRPGMRLRWLGALGRTVKRLLRQKDSPGVSRIGKGERAETLPSRHGTLGWIWAFMVTISFVRQIRKEQRRARGVLLYDRHLLDALVTLDVVYEGVSLGLHRALVRSLVPRADLTMMVVVPPSLALARKPNDMFVEAVLERQARSYAAHGTEAPSLHELDGTRPLDELAAEGFRLVANIGASS